MKLKLNDTVKNIAIALQEHQIFLTGSFALLYQGLNLNRKAHDVDFVFNGEINDIHDIVKNIFKTVCGVKNKHFVYETEEYATSEYLTGCMINGVLFEIRFGSDISTKEVDGIIMQDYRQILAKKLDYAMSGSLTRDKHIKDLELFGIGVNQYKSKYNEYVVARNNFEAEKRRMSHLVNSYAYNQHNFKVECKRSGQVGKYKDCVYEYHITSPLTVEEFEELARKTYSKIKRCCVSRYRFFWHITW